MKNVRINYFQGLSAKRQHQLYNTIREHIILGPGETEDLKDLTAPLPIVPAPLEDSEVTNLFIELSITKSEPKYAYKFYAYKKRSVCSLQNCKSTL